MRLLAWALPLVLAAGLTGAGRSGGSDDPTNLAFDRVVRGDVVAAAAGVTACRRLPPARCDSSAPFGRWADSDGDATTYNAGTAQVAVPHGASVVHALLVWAGSAAQAASPGPDPACVSGGRMPPGSPEHARVRLRVGNRSADVAPRRFEKLGQPPMRWYRAAADVTAAFADTAGPVSVTVGNVWAPEGPGCSGGWAVLVAWERAPAPARRVVLADTALLTPPEAEARLSPPGLRVSGGDVAVTAAVFGATGPAGDAHLAVNGRRGGRGFAGPVEARRVVAGPEVIPPGSSSVRIAVRSDRDALLLGGLALSVPLPGLEVTTTVEPSQLMEGQEYQQEAVVRNTGDVPLDRVRATFGPAPGCAHDLPPLPPRASVAAGCTRIAHASHTEATATAVATAPDGQTVAAGDTAELRVLVVPPATVRAVPPRPAAPRHAAPQPERPPEARPPAVAPTPAPPGKQPRAQPAQAPPELPRAQQPASAPPKAALSPEPTPQPAPAPAEIVVEASGPLDSPARTAAVIAVLGVFVMTVSVGAFSAALKPKPR